MSDSNESGETITKQLLKTKSGEFDIESIHSISLREMDISDLGCLGECTMLERLDLYGNDIIKLYALAGLASLSHLNLGANRITSLEGLQSMDNLQSLNLAGNLIGSIDNLKCLNGLEKLKELRLKDTIHDLSNPICMNNTYKMEVLQILPNLHVLDGERLSGPGSELFRLCNELDKTLQDNGRISQCMELADSGPWVPPGYWTNTAEQQFEATVLGDSEKQLEDLLTECRRVTAAADVKLQAMIQTSQTTESTTS